MPDWGTIRLECENCGEVVEGLYTKVNAPFSCGECHHVQQTPGIAEQEQATAGQLLIIERAASRHCRAVVVVLSLLAILLLTAYCADKVQERWGLPSWAQTAMGPTMLTMFLALVGAGVYLLLTEQTSVECVGFNKTFAVLLFFFCLPMWLLQSIMVLFLIRRSIKRLKSVGPRP